MLIAKPKLDEDSSPLGVVVTQTAVFAISKSISSAADPNSLSLTVRNISGELFENQSSHDELYPRLPFSTSPSRSTESKNSRWTILELKTISRFLIF